MKIQIMRTEKKVREFSKNFVAVLCLLWIMGALFGAVVVWRQPEQLSYLLEYIGAPMVGGIIGYMAKAALENREKIKNNAANQQQDEPGGPG